MQKIASLSKQEVDRICHKVIGAAIDVHKHLGPGLLESVYHKCLSQELRERKLVFQSGLMTPLEYKGTKTEAELRCDFLVETCLVVEIKAVDALVPVHEAQLLTYMRLLQAPKGVLINFHCVNLFYGGQKTMVNHLYKDLPSLCDR